MTWTWTVFAACEMLVSRWCII